MQGKSAPPTRSLLYIQLASDDYYIVQRIMQMDKNTLCKEIYEEGKANGWPGLGQEVTNICKEIGLPDLNENMITKSLIKEAINAHHYGDMKKELEKSSKLEGVKNEDLREVQKYFQNKSVENGRLAFKIRSHMVQDIPGNFKNKFRKNKDGLICSYCSEMEIMTQSHCVRCPAWTEQRAGLDLTNIDDMVVFFRKLLAERTRLDKLDV